MYSVPGLGFRMRRRERDDLCRVIWHVRPRCRPSRAPIVGLRLVSARAAHPGSWRESGADDWRRLLVRLRHYSPVMKRIEEINRSAPRGAALRRAHEGAGNVFAMCRPSRRTRRERDVRKILRMLRWDSLGRFGHTLGWVNPGQFGHTRAPSLVR